MEDFGIPGPGGENTTFEQFIMLLSKMLITDNDIRSQAEAVYDKIPVESRGSLLLHCLQPNAFPLNPDTEQVRMLAAVMFRRLLSTEFDCFWPKLTPEAQQNIKNELLLLVQRPDIDSSFKHKVSDVVAELSRNLVDDSGENKWPEFLKFLFDGSSSDNVVMRECSLHIFSLVPSVFANQQHQFLDVIKQMLLKSLEIRPENPPTVRLSAVKAATAFLSSNEKEDQVQKYLIDLLPSLIDNIFLTTVDLDDDAAVKCLVELAENCPTYLRPRCSQIFESVLKMLTSEEFTEETKEMALEVVVTLCETSPAMVRKVAGKYIPNLLNHILTVMMTDLSDDNLEQWALNDKEPDNADDMDEVADAAEAALDRIACGLGGKAVLQPLMHILPEMLNSPNWKYRSAALMGLSSVGEACCKVMEPFLAQIIPTMVNYLRDAHPKVCFAACNAIGQMSTDFAPTLAKRFHKEIVGGLLLALNEDKWPKVQGHSAAAMVNFAESCPKDILINYLDEIMGCLEGVLSKKFKELIEKGNMIVLEQVVTTLASVADSTEEKFIQYYDKFMPCLKYILQNANNEELKLLRGKTVECISLIGLAVGKEKFAPDAGEVMDLLLKTQTDSGSMAEDDPQVSYMISAWARMCKILGPQFQQYLPLVMDPVMKTASIKPDVTILDSDDTDEMDDGDWSFVTLGDQQSFGVRTSALEDKATACQMLVCYARELKENFAEYAEPVIRLMVPLLKFYFHDGVRSAASESLPHLLECAKGKGHQFQHDVWDFVCPELLSAIESEPDMDMLSEHLASLAQCVEVMGPRCLADYQLTNLVTLFIKLYEKHFESATERQKKRADEDYDELVEEELNDMDDEDTWVLAKMSDVLHALFIVYKVDLLQYFDRLLPHFVRLITSGSWSDRQWAVCTFDDVIEYGGEASFKYQEYFVRYMIVGLTDTKTEVRQACAYGIGAMAQFGGPSYLQICSECLRYLEAMVNAPNSRDDLNIAATENAISSFMKILRYTELGTGETGAAMHAMWLGWLPIYEDDEECLHVYDYLCDLIEQNNPVVLGLNNCNVPRLVAVFAEVFSREALDRDSAVAQRVVNIVKQIQTNGEMFQACVAQLNSQQQTAILELVAP